MPEALFPSLMIRGRKRLVSENIRYFFHGERAYHDSFCRAPDFPDATSLPNFILCQRMATKIGRSEEHTSELQSRENLVCRLLLEKKKKNYYMESIFFIM